MEMDRSDLLNIILQKFSVDTGVSTQINIENFIDTLLIGFPQSQSNRQWLKDKALEALVTQVEAAQELVNPDECREWLTDASKQSWCHWPWLKLYFQEKLKRPTKIISELDRSTDRIINFIGDPKVQGMFDRRGLVVGHVQSGKTQHYTALVTKAIDAGYKIVIILTGVHENLRQQTQERIEECVTGKDSRSHWTHTGVREFSARRALSGNPGALPQIDSLTSVEGDYGTQVTKIIDTSLGATPAIFVIKKNATILRNVLKKLRGGNAPFSAFPYPVLVIDDEADHSSVDTSKITEDTDPATINKLIRGILWCCNKVAFVGYTATPYANIFMSAEWQIKTEGRKIDDWGSDLFPRAFIIGLEAPSNYLGAEAIFGRPSDDSINLAEVAPLPMRIDADDSEEWLPAKHKNGYQITQRLPASLSLAVKTFILGVAAKMAMGQGSEHCSMLVHVTRFTSVQEQVRFGVKALLEKISTDLSSSVDRNMHWEHLEQLWNDEFCEKLAEFQAHPSQSLCPPELPDWGAVKELVAESIARVQCSAINSSTKSNLDYAGNREKGLVIIAVGGDRLSRGLTLEGLMCSYFLRGARAYDTLMQMGRWFGYRPGYAHLCRVFASEGTVRSFRNIALASEELRGEFARMIYLKRTPADYGLSVREPKADLLVTALNKMRRGETVKLHFGESLISSLEIHSKDNALNYLAFKDMVAALPATKRERTKAGFNLWRDIPRSTVEQFLMHYKAINHACLDDNQGKIGSLLLQYIGKVGMQGELCNWTIGIASSMDQQPLWEGADIRAVTRKRLRDKEGGIVPKPLKDGLLSFKAIAVGTDEKLGLSQQQIDEAEMDAESNRVSSKARGYRLHRSPTNGLILIYPILPDFDTPEEVAEFQAVHGSGKKLVIIGVAVSLPSSMHDEGGMEYVCNRKKLREIFGEEFGEDIERDQQEDEAIL